MKSFNVRFLSETGKIDETQFDIQTNVFDLPSETADNNPLSEKIDIAFMMSQILDLWEQFCQENKFALPLVLDVYEVPYVSEDGGE